MIDNLALRCIDGDVRSVARLITLLENGEKEAFGALNALKEYSGRAQVIGITGPPGSGKSTLTDKLISEFRARGKRVGVLAVDPSSPFSGGAILGDRLRMQDHATDPGVFIRSLASRGALGGLSKATASAVRVLDAAGYDIVIIETVGVGQSEIDIVKVADTVVLISVPGLGDDIQVIKAGIMEIGDIFVVNKSDREGADRVVREIRAMLETQIMLQHGQSVPTGPDTLSARNAELLHHGAGGAALTPVPAADAADGRFALPPVLKTVAETGQGVEEVAEAIVSHFEKSKTSGELERRRLNFIQSQLKDLVSWQVMDYFVSHEGTGQLNALARSVHERKTDIFSAAKELFSAFMKGGFQ